MSQTATARHHKRKPNTSGRSMLPATFGAHINELRVRFFWVAAAFLLASCLAYTYQKELLAIVMAPLQGEKLIYLTPGGGFSLIFQVAIYAGIIVSLPLIVYQLYAFVRPALPVNAKRSATKIIAAASLLIVGGVSYGYFVAVPAALAFLNDFAGDAVTPSLTADSYLNFFLAYVGGLAILSLLPLLLLFWHWIHPLTPRGLLKSQRWVILAAFIIAAIITPTPDVVNQSMIAGPVVGLYQFGVAAVLVSHRRSKLQVKKKKQEPPVIATDKIRTHPTATQTSANSAYSIARARPLTVPARQQTRALSTTQTSAPVASRFTSSPSTRRTRSIDGFSRPASLRVAAPMSEIVKSI